MEREQAISGAGLLFVAAILSFFVWNSEDYKILNNRIGSTISEKLDLINDDGQHRYALLLENFNGKHETTVTYQEYNKYECGQQFIEHELSKMGWALLIITGLLIIVGLGLLDCLELLVAFAD